MEPPTYSRYRRRFLRFSSKLPPASDYMKPALELEELDKWDRYVRLRSPYYLVFHDVGDWKKPANRHIKFQGAVAAFFWDLLQDELEHGQVITEEAIDQMVRRICEKFTGCPDTSTVRSDLKELVGRLPALELLSPNDISV